VVEREYELLRQHRENGDSIHLAHGSDGRAGDRKRIQSTTTGWAPTCQCNRDDVVPATVLDCFSGSGTTLRVALKLGRSAIGIDLSSTYLEDLAPERLGNIQMEMPL
jgi:hypothetical protein